MARALLAAALSNDFVKLRLQLLSKAEKKKKSVEYLLLKR